jgi:tRNA 2-thiouridine synthesizing protein B
MILHTLNAPPSSNVFSECLSLLQPGDALLLMGDGVYAALSDTSSCSALVASGADIYALVDDARAAGVLDRIEHATALDMDGFVELSERFERQLGWY